MGVSSNPKIFLSDKDLKGANIVDPELGLLLHNEDHHLFKLKQLSVQEHHQQQQKDHKDRHQEQQNQRQRNTIIVITKPVCPITLKLDIPSSYVGSEENEDDDGYATPTSSEKKIPVIPECPGAPKKTKPKPAAKRKACCRRRTVLDLSQDLESLFPVPCVVDLGGGGVKKRVKQC